MNKVTRIDKKSEAAQRAVFLERVAANRNGHRGDIIARQCEFEDTALIARAAKAFAKDFPDEAVASAPHEHSQT